MVQRRLNLTNRGTNEVELDECVLVQTCVFIFSLCTCFWYFLTSCRAILFSISHYYCLLRSFSFIYVSSGNIIFFIRKIVFLSAYIGDILWNIYTQFIMSAFLAFAFPPPSILNGRDCAPYYRLIIT